MLPNHYHFQDVERRLAKLWEDSNIYAFNPHGSGPLYTIDTPPPTVSGELHLGHCYSYIQTDVIARFHRMCGERVLYPMGFDDNGLPTERFVERTTRRKAIEMDRTEFLERCLTLIQQTEDRFESLWRRLSLSIDWNYRYSTIDVRSQATSQWSFIQLHKLGRVYAQSAPTLWRPDCRTAIAQADLEDKIFPTLFTTFAFHLLDGQDLPIATTRPELLSACVAIFVYPDDARYNHLAGSFAWIESEAFSQHEKIEVPILTDDLVDPMKGSGAVMCCTFGDATDVRWWRLHQLPLRAAIRRDGCMTELSGPLVGSSIKMARKLVLQYLANRDLILHQETIEHAVGTHDRCGMPVEYLQTRQWFIRVLDQKERFVEIEHFFWSDLCDNYLELAKSRLYNDDGDKHAAAQWTLYHALLNILKLFAPYLPYVTEEIYQGLFRQWNEAASIHNASWPSTLVDWMDAGAETSGALLLEILSYVRRKKAESCISVGAELKSLQITIAQAYLPMIQAASCDIQSATRARTLIFTTSNEPDKAQVQRWHANIVLP